MTETLFVGGQSRDLQTSHAVYLPILLKKGTLSHPENVCMNGK